VALAAQNLLKRGIHLRIIVPERDQDNLRASVEEGPAGRKRKCCSHRRRGNEGTPAGGVVSRKDAYSVAAKVVLVDKKCGFPNARAASAHGQDVRCFLTDLGPRHKVLQIIHCPGLTAVSSQLGKLVFALNHPGDSAGQLSI
jgi:hypothetical protein